MTKNGSPESDITVRFNIATKPTGSTGALITFPLLRRTDSNGRAQGTLTLGNRLGTYTVTASPIGSTRSVTFTATARSGSTTTTPPRQDKIATRLLKRTGDRQSAPVNTRLRNPFVVRVLDQFGAAMGGVPVSFSVSPSGQLSASTATTDINGEASTTLTLGNTIGTYTVTARVHGIANSVTFTATAEAAPPPTPEKVATTLEKQSGDGQSAIVKTQLISPMVVRVLDQDGAAFSGASVSFSVSPSGNLSTTAATTDTNGEALTTLTLGDTPGTYTVTASVTILDVPLLTVEFTATAKWKKIIVVNTKPKVIAFSEIMFQSQGGLHSPPQWIEIRSSAKYRVNLRGWKLTLKRRADNPIRIEDKNILEVTVTIQEDFIIPPKYARLITTFNSRNSGLRTQESERIYNLFAHHIDELDQNERNRNRVLDPDGFSLTLRDGLGEVIDVIGNLENGETQWEFPDCYVNRIRSSMFRKFDDGMPLDGTVQENWVRASDAKSVMPNIYYGNATDIGTPGYRGGDILPVTLSSFRLQNTDPGVVINWTTESEVENAGFNIYRGLSKEGTFVKINAKMIQGAGTTGERNQYQWRDTTAKPNTIYYYRLEDVSYAGVHTQSATVRLKGVVTAQEKMTTMWGDLKR